MLIANNWTDFELIDAADGEKLERWGKYILRRPDPQAIWTDKSEPKAWHNAQAVYKRSATGGGGWNNVSKSLPKSWQIKYKELTFNIKLMGFKHTGLFPEQAVNWDWFGDLIKNANRPIKVLNAFAYTGGATVAALSVGAEVVHLDAAKGMVDWAKENVKASGLEGKNVRYIVDDVVKFVEREARRGNKYDAIIMDPPSYGRGPKGEVWKLEDELYPLVLKCMQILSDKPLFFLINSYTTGIGASVLSNILTLTMKKNYGGMVSSDEIGLGCKSSEIVLPCGISGRWENRG